MVKCLKALFACPALRRFSEPFNSIAGVTAHVTQPLLTTQTTITHSCSTHTYSHTLIYIERTDAVDSNCVTVIMSLIKISTHTCSCICARVCVMVWQTDGHTTLWWALETHKFSSTLLIPIANNSMLQRSSRFKLLDNCMSTKCM